MEAYGKNHMTNTMIFVRDRIAQSLQLYTFSSIHSSMVLRKNELELS